MYSSALLDAYMDYKLIWKQIQTSKRFVFHLWALADICSSAIWEVDNNVSSLAARTAAAALTEYAEDFNKAFAEQKKKYEASQKPDNRGAITQGHIEEPIPPNKVVPYGGDIFGLDKARRDCRFEMIKIVREVCVHSRVEFLKTVTNYAQGRCCSIRSCSCHRSKQKLSVPKSGHL